MDVIIATETFLLEPVNIQGLYGAHTYATPTEGRPEGGASCFFKPAVGQLINIYK